MRSPLAIVLAIAIVTLGFGGVASPAHDPSLTNSEHPGSVLIFPKFIRGGVGGLPAATFEIGVVCPDDAPTCLIGGTNKVVIQAHWVCPGSPDGSSAGRCHSTDFELRTVTHGKLEFDASGRVTVGPFDLNGGLIPIPPCEEGYLVASIANQSGVPIAFNGLVGEAILRFTPNSASAYNAVTIQSPQPAGTPLGSLEFDGVSYRRVSSRLVGDLRYEKLQAPTVRTFLTILNVASVPNAINPSVAMPVNFRRASGAAVSDVLRFTCFRQVRLTHLNPNLTNTRMGKKGLLEASGDATAVETAGRFIAGQRVPVLGLVTTIEDGTTPAQSKEYTYHLYGRGDGAP
jgi:hypothetical protein